MCLPLGTPLHREVETPAVPWRIFCVPKPVAVVSETRPQRLRDGALRMATGGRHQETLGTGIASGGLT